MTKKKKMILVIITGIVVLLAGTLVFLYNYERPYFDDSSLDSVIPVTDMDQWKAEHMEAFRISFFGSVESGDKSPTDDDKLISLTKEQRTAIQEILENRQFEKYLKLWYRYDAMLVCGDDITYKVDLKNQLVFMDGVYVGRTPMTMFKMAKPLRGCVRLTAEETQVLKDIIKGSTK